MPASHVALSHVEGRVGWFPWSGSFFIGFLVGQQTIQTWNTTYVDLFSVKTPLESTLKMSSYYMTPHFGWQYVFSSGFLVGCEFGVQLPLDANPVAVYSVTATPHLPPSLLAQEDTYKKSKKDIENTIKIFGQMAIPYWKILKLGFLL